VKYKGRWPVLRLAGAVEQLGRNASISVGDNYAVTEERHLKHPDSCGGGVRSDNSV
jgi:hypothetical protein